MGNKVAASSKIAKAAEFNDMNEINRLMAEAKEKGKEIPKNDLTVALHISTGRGYETAAQKFVEAGADVCALADDDFVLKNPCPYYSGLKVSLLHKAALIGSRKLVTLFLDRGALPLVDSKATIIRKNELGEVVREQDSTPFYCVMVGSWDNEMDRDEAGKLIFSKKINIENVFWCSRTALLVGASKGLEELTRMLIVEQANMFKTDKDGRNALQLAVIWHISYLCDYVQNYCPVLDDVYKLGNDKIIMMNYFIKNGHDPKITDSEGNTLMHLAAYYWSYRSYYATWKIAPLDWWNGFLRTATYRYLKNLGLDPTDESGPKNKKGLTAQAIIMEAVGRRAAAKDRESIK